MVRLLRARGRWPWSAQNHAASHHRNLVRLLGRALETLGDYPPTEIRRADIEDWLTARSGETFQLPGWSEAKPVTAATANRALFAVKAVLKRAVDLELIPTSPAGRVRPVREAPNQPRLLEPEEVVRLLEALPQRLTALVATAAYAGLRAGELFSLEWSDIYLANSVIAVSPRGQERRTKNQKARRVPIVGELTAILGEHARVRRLGTRWCSPGRRTPSW